MNEWQNKTLFRKIESMWTDMDGLYNRVTSSRDTIIENFRPDMDLEIGSSYDSRLLGHDIYDSTGVWAAHLMAVGFYAHQYSKNIDWINYKFQLDILRGVDELDQFCTNVKEHMASVYQRGNFYDTQLQYAKNAITIGSPCSFGEEKDGQIMWTPLHYTTYRLYYDGFNRPIGVIVKDKKTIKEIYDKFCEGNTPEQRNAKAQKIFSNSMMSYINAGQWNEKIVIWRAVFKRTHPVFTANDFGKRYEYWDCYYEDAPKDENVPLWSGGYFTKPFVVWDYEKNPWEGVSRTPAYYCIYDDVTLNQIMFNYITDAQMGSNPPMQLLGELKEKYDIEPGGKTYLERDQWEYKAEVIERARNIHWETEQLNMFRDNCQRHFHTPLFNILTELALKHKQPISATQALEIKDEKITQISPMIESNDNYLRQVDTRSLDIEYRAGRGPFRPDYMMYIADIILWACKKANVQFNGDLVPEFIGKLRQEQQMEQKLKPLRLGLAYLDEVRRTVEPDINLAVRPYRIADRGLEAVSFPMDCMKTEQEYEEDYTQLQEARAQQIQFQNMVEAAKATKGQEVKQ